MSDSSQRVMFITGASKGIGRYLAEFYCQLGFFVFGCSRSACDLKHDNYFHLEGDVTSEASVKSFMKTIREKKGRLDVVLNNAGVASMNHSLLVPFSTVERLFSTNVFGTFLVSREAARLLQKSSSPRIVNFSTVAVALDLEGEAVYAASKAAVESLTRVMAKELSSWGITVNAVGPTPVKTDLIRSISEEKINELLAKQAIKRLGTFEDVQNLISFFIDPKTNFVTGQIVYLGGVVP